MYGVCCEECRAAALCKVGKHSYSAVCACIISTQRNKVVDCAFMITTQRNQVVVCAFMISTHRGIKSLSVSS